MMVSTEVKITKRHHSLVDLSVGNIDESDMDENCPGDTEELHNV